MIKKLVLILIIYIIISCMYGSGRNDKQYSLVPFIAYSNETRLMGGGFLNFQKDLYKDKKMSELTLSSLLIYSANQQFQLLLLPRYSFNQEKTLLSFDLKGRHWPDKLWGIGNNTPESAGESYTQEEFQFGLGLEHKVYQQLYLTGKADYRIENILRKTPGGTLAEGNIIGSDAGNHYLGKGLGLRWKSTDNNNYPTRGENIKLQYMQYSYPQDSFSTNNTYDIVALDVNYYISPVKGWVLASQSSFIQTENNIPFSFLPELGSKLRAYDSKRYIDKALLSQRIEQRLIPSELSLMQTTGLLQSKTWQRLGLVVFSEAGQVAPHVERFGANRFHWSNGFGLRYSILPKEKLNLRFDFGFGEETFNFIVQGTEAF